MEVQGKKVKVNGLCMFMRYCEAYDFVLLVVTCKVPIMLMFMRFLSKWHECITSEQMSFLECFAYPHT